MLFWRVIDFDLQGQIELQSQNLPQDNLFHILNALCASRLFYRYVHQQAVSWALNCEHV